MLTSQLQDIQRSVSFHVNISLDTGNWRNESSGTTKEYCKKKEDLIGGYLCPASDHGIFLEYPLWAQRREGD